MRKIYDNIVSILRNVSFDSIWDEFRLMDFALYNKTTVYLADGEIPYDNRFLGNTSIDYNGVQLAIWYIDNESNVNIEELVACIVHEMFHSFQYEQGECRYPNDLVGLDYPQDIDNYCIKYEENRLIVKAINSNDYLEKMELLHKFIKFREYRLDKFGEKIKYEMYTETLEGMAEYAGTMALKQISCDLYEKRVTEYKKLLNDINVLFDVRRCSYYTGTLFLLLLEDMNIPIPYRITGEKLTIYEQIAHRLRKDSFSIPYPNIHSNGLFGVEPDISIINNEYNAIIKEKFIEASVKKNKLFRDFFHNQLIKVDGNFSICGYDPMNTVKVEGNIYCSHFINLQNKDTKEIVFIPGPIVLLSVPNSYYEVSGYFIIKDKYE